MLNHKNKSYKKRQKINQKAAQAQVPLLSHKGSDTVTTAAATTATGIAAGRKTKAEESTWHGNMPDYETRATYAKLWEQHFPPRAEECVGK